MRRMVRCLTVVAVMVGALVIGPTPPAEAAAACTMNITFTYAPGITVVPGPTFVAGTMTLTCPVLTPDAGMWVLPFAGPAGLESCEAGTAVMAFGPAIIGPAGLAGTFTYAHGYAGLTAVHGVITWPGNTRTLLGTGEWLPVLLPGNCVAPPVTSAVATGVAALA